ncbi:MAG: hypothetical protein HOV94_36670 [Saccharothrix sp.]|nr:hypothetical protein [Saccharothrix sp.]
MLEWLRRWFGRGNDISSEGVATAGTVNSMSGRAQTVVQAGVIGNLTVGPDDRSLLREITEANLSTLSGHAGLPGSHDGVRVRRAELDMLLATGGDFVITGEPGCGKSGLLAVIAEHLVENAETVVVLSVDTLGSRVGVARGDVSLSRPLSAVLKDWEGEGRATLLLDGLDAARGEPLTWLADVVRDLQGSRWRTIATMRSFDLRRSRTWSMVFSGAPVSEGADHRDGELLKVRHFRLGDLSEAELAWLAAARPDIGALIAGADGPLLDLIRNPFNLRLACELLDEGVEQATLVNARDQLDLLQRYWQARVDHRPDGEARKRVLNRVSRAMLDRRTLRAGMDVVPDSLLDACAALVHDGVLDELRARLKASGGAQLVYSHHILFDFAIAALVLTAADRSNLVDVLDGDPNLVFVIRPSIDLHLADLWHANDTRATFADVARSLAAADHSLAGIAAARVVVAEAREDGDVLWIAGEEDQDSGFEITAGWVAGVMDAADDPMRAWVRVNSRPWATLAARMMARLEHSFQPVVVEQVYRLLVQLDKIGAVATDETAAPVWADCVARLMSLALDEPIERERLAEAVSRFLPRAVAIAPRHVGVLRRTLDPRLALQLPHEVRRRHRRHRHGRPRTGGRPAPQDHVIRRKPRRRHTDDLRRVLPDQHPPPGLRRCQAPHRPTHDRLHQQGRYSCRGTGVARLTASTKHRTSGRVARIPTTRP